MNRFFATQSTAFVFLSLVMTAGCSGKEVGSTQNPVSGDSGTPKVDGGGARAGSGGGAQNTGGSGAGGAPSAGGSAGSGNGTMFCGVETCGPNTKCCPLTGKCYDPNGSTGCTGMGCAGVNGQPPDPSCCGNGLVFCPTNQGCYHAGCENCCAPDVTCNQQADCPSGFSCCYNSRRCYNPLIENCGGGPPACAADGSCPGNMVCCQLHGNCYDPGCTDCCPTTCAPQGTSCSAQMPCCNGGNCCSGVPIQPGHEYCAGNFGCPVSDRNAKHDITPLDPDQVLERVASMSISSWSYNDGDTGARHIGPMAQDFHDAFGTGSSDKCIPTVDANGVALAAIQALYRRVERLDGESRALRDENASLRRELDGMRKRR